MMDFTWLFIVGGIVIVATVLAFFSGLFLSRASLKQANVWRTRLDSEMRSRVEAVHDLDQLKTTLAQKQHDNKGLAQQVVGLQQQISATEEAMRATQQKANGLSNNERMLRTQLGHSTTQGTDTARKLVLQQNNIEALRQQIEQVNADLAQAQKKLLNQQQVATQLEQRLTDQRVEREQTRLQQGKHVNAIQSLQADLSRTKKQLADTQRENSRLESWLAMSFNMDVNTSNSGELVASAQRMLNNYQQQVAYQQKQMLALTDQLHERNSALEHAQLESLDRLAVIASLTAQLQQTSLEIAESAMINDGLNIVASQAHHGARDAAIQLESQQAAARQLLGEKDDMNKQLVIKDRLIEHRDQGVMTLRNDLQKLQTRYDSLKIEFLTDQGVKGVKVDAARVLADNDMHLSPLARIARDLLVTQEEINHMYRSVDQSQQDVIATLQKNVTQFHGKVAGGSANAGDGSELSKAQREVEEMRRQKRQIENMADSYQKRYSQVQNKNNELTTQLRDTNQELIETQDNLKDARAQMVEVRSKYEEARQTVQAQVYQTNMMNDWGSLSKIASITTDHAAQLRANGIITINDLANATPERVQQMFEKPVGMTKFLRLAPDVDEWIRQAKHLVELDTQHSQHRANQPNYRTPSFTSTNETDVDGLGAGVTLGF